MAYRDELKEKFDARFGDGLATFVFTMFGPRAAAVEGAKRIVYYDDKCVKFAVGRRILEISGNGLQLCSCNGNEYYVSGEILKAEVSR